MHSKIFRDDLLKGKVALVTGGGTGIGVAIARELGKLGATIIIASRKATNIDPAAKGLTKELGHQVHGRLLDIRDRETLNTSLVQLVEEFGKIDLLVNNGGGQFFAPAEAITPRGWDAVIGTNLTGTWNMTRAVADATMLEHGGKIINITMLTKRTFPGMTHSVAARAGVEAMTRTLAIEWAKNGILLNAIAPGFVASSGLRTYPDGLDLVTQMQSLVPLKRLATCEEIAWYVAYLASPAGDYVTGQTVTVDGGKELWGDYWPIDDPEPMEPFVIPVEPWEDLES